MSNPDSKAEKMSFNPVSDYELLHGLARARAIYGNGEGLAIALDLGVCYWCKFPLNADGECSKNCNPSERIQELLNKNLARELARVGIKNEYE